MSVRYIGARELAERWGITKKTIYNWVSSGQEMPPVYRFGGQVRWKLDEVEAWEQQQKEAA